MTLFFEQLVHKSDLNLALFTLLCHRLCIDMTENVLKLIREREGEGEGKEKYTTIIDWCCVECMCIEAEGMFIGA